MFLHLAGEMGICWQHSVRWNVCKVVAGYLSTGILAGKARSQDRPMCSQQAEILQINHTERKININHTEKETIQANL